MKDLFELDGFRPFDAIVMCVYVNPSSRYTHFNSNTFKNASSFPQGRENEISFLKF